jgi:membrane protein DedA with SNARE-associated domain
VNDLPGVFGAVAPYLDSYGYTAVALIVLLENLSVPLLGEAAIVTGAIFASSGRLDLILVALVAFLAAVVGATGAYAVGRFGGRPLALRLGRRVGIKPAHLDRVDAFFTRHGSKVVLGARFLPIVRHVNGLSAGVSTMTWRRFVVANAIGAAIWVTVWTVVGAEAGKHVDGVNTALEKGTPILLGVLVAAVLASVLRRRVRGRRTPEVSS